MAKKYNILPLALGTDYFVLSRQSDVLIPPLREDGLSLSLSAGVYTWEGAAIAFNPMPLGAGEYVVTGSDISFSRTDNHFAWTGQDVVLQATRYMSLEGAAYAFDGQDLGIVFRPGEEPPAAKVAYLFTLTGAADGVADVEIPVKSIQARMRSGSPTYLQVSIPGLAEYEDYIAARTNGTMQVDVAYIQGGEYVLRETILSVTLDDIRTDTGPFNKSITLTGRQQKTYTNKTITLYRPTYKQVLNGAARVRFAEPHVYLFPGDTVVVGTDTLTANVISYYVAARTGGMDTVMEIAEASV